MSTNSTANLVIPDSFFYSVFRNCTKHVLYVWWAGSHGMNIPPEEHFRIIGDPRIPPSIPKAHGMVESIKAMIEDGVIEFCSSPAPVIDNNRPDGRSMALFARDGDPVLDTIPLSKEELGLRVLPSVTPICTWDSETGEIFIDWSATDDLEIHDSFFVTVTPPTGKPVKVRCGVDKQTRFTPKAGPGLYKILVMLKAVDERVQEGTETEITVPGE